MNIGDLFFCSKCMRKIEEEGICPHCGHNPDGPVSKSALEEGILLQNGRYQLGAVLGIGGFGITYAAWDHTLAQPVAIKEYFPRAFSDRDIQETDSVLVTEGNQQPYEIGLLRFNREARILSTLQNIKSVVTVHDWFEANGTAYIVMEFVRGQTLEQYVRDESLPPTRLFAMLRDLIDSLVSIHAQGVLHRDISPANLLVQEDETVKLIDFGAAAMEERRAQGKDRTVIFSRIFAPPEQYDENGSQGPWTDVYALSATLYYLITKEPPQDALSRKDQDTLKALENKNIRLKKWEKKAILDGMLLSPQKRIQNMDIFRSILYHLPMPEEIQRRRRFMIKTFTVMAGITVVIILLIVNALWGFPAGHGLRLGIRPDGLHVTGCGRNTETLSIPSDIMGIPVTEIEDGALSWNPNLREVFVPGSVKQIGPRAFSGCENLLSITVNEGNQSVSEYAFSDCPALRTVVLPVTTEPVSATAFSGHDDALTVWCEDGSFAHRQISGYGINLAALSDYETVENDTGISVINYHGIISENEPADSLTVPDYIGNQPITSFKPQKDSPMFPSELTSIKLPEFLEYLPEGVINDSFTLEKVELGTALKEIGPYAFNRTGIKSLNLPPTLTTVGEEAFSDSFIEEIIFPDSVSEVGDYTFYTCRYLTSAVLSDRMKTIPEGMFRSCLSLTDVTLPQKLESIGFCAFDNCSALETIKLPDTVETIEAYAFHECENMRIIYIPPRTVYIDAEAFNGCPTDMVIAGISGSVAEQYAGHYSFPFLAVDQWDYDRYLVAENGDFYIGKETEPEAITKLPSVFAGETKCCVLNRLVLATNLKSNIVILPEYATSVSACAFMGNNYVTNIYSYQYLQEIGDGAFRNCQNLRQFYFQDGIRTIERMAFAEDTQLTDIVFPDTLRQIEAYAFARCKNLTEINIPSAMILLNDGCFAETGITDIRIPENIAKCNAAFYGCKDLKTATIEEGVRTLWGTFSQCSSLESVILPSTMTEVSRSTFHGCSALKDVWIYSMNADLDFVLADLNYVAETTITEEGRINANKIFLETGTDTTPLLFADCPDVMIHGYPGSTAETYAREHGIGFEAIEATAEN